jgi:hypothetical protein
LNQIKEQNSPAQNAGKKFLDVRNAKLFLLNINAIVAT